MMTSALRTVAPQTRTAVAGLVAAGVPVFYNLPQASGLNYGYAWSLTFNHSLGGLILDVATGMLCLVSPLSGVVCMLLSAA